MGISVRHVASVRGRIEDGAVKQVGRVAIFDEAAMFTEQTCGPTQTPMGMNSPVARDNARFVLNVVSWLAGRIG